MIGHKLIRICKRCKTEGEIVFMNFCKPCYKKEMRKIKQQEERK